MQISFPQDLSEKKSKIYHEDGVPNNNMLDGDAVPLGEPVVELQVVDLVKDPKLRRHTILMSTLW